MKEKTGKTHGKLYLIIGGAASGKSGYAEQLAHEVSGKNREPLIYLATMQPSGEEAAERIAKHRRNRAGRGFRTMERTTGLAGLEVPEGACVLLEDMGNLLANEMFLPDGGGRQAVLDGIRHIREQAGDLVIVSNEIFSDGEIYTGETRSYMEDLAGINCVLAEEADLVAEVICGIPRVRKGGQI